MPSSATLSLQNMRRLALAGSACALVCGLCLCNSTRANASQSAQQEKSLPQAPAAQTPDNSGIYRQSWDLLDRGSKSESLRKRTDVIAALSSMEGDSKAIRLLEVALDDKHSAVRRLAASSLGTMNAREAIPFLRQATNDKDAGVSFAAAEALWKMGDRSGATIFYAVLLGNRHVAKGFVSSQVDTAWNELHNPAALANIAIGEASGALLGPFSEGITIARELAKDRGAPAQALSATLLGEHPNPDAEKVLVEALHERNIGVRAAVAKALGGFDDPALIPHLEPLMSEKGTPIFRPVGALRFMAAAAIIRIYNHEKPDAPIVTANLRRPVPLASEPSSGKQESCPEVHAGV